MKNRLLLIAVLLSFPVFSQIGTYKFSQSLNTKFDKLFQENRSTLTVLDKPNYGDVKLTINNHEAYFDSKNIEEFTNSGNQLIYCLLTNRKTKENVTLKFYYEGQNPTAIFIFKDGSQLHLQNDLKF